jgi:hypothetical protein
MFHVNHSCYTFMHDLASPTTLKLGAKGTNS